MKGQITKHKTRLSGYYWIHIANMPFAEPAFYDHEKKIWRIIGDTNTYTDFNLWHIEDKKIQEPKHDWRMTAQSFVVYCAHCECTRYADANGAYSYRQAEPLSKNTTEEPPCVTRKIQADESTHNNIL